LSARFLVQRILQPAGTHSRILEVGAGRSIVAPVLTETGRKLRTLTLLDKSAAMLAHSFKWKDRGVGMIIADARSTSLSSATYDVVVASLCDPYNQIPFWQEIQRLLVSGGICLVTLPAPEWVARFRKKDVADTAEFLLADGRLVAMPSFVPSVHSQLTMIQKTGLSVSEIVAFTTTDLTGSVSPKLNVFTPGGDGAVLRGYTVVKS